MSQLWIWIGRCSIEMQSVWNHGVWSFSFARIVAIEWRGIAIRAFFFMASGSLKEIARQWKVSYPTVRNHLDDLIEKIKKIKQDEN